LEEKMQIMRLLSSLAISMLLIACSTTVTNRTALPQNAIGTMKFEGVEVVRGNSGITAEEMDRLRMGLTDRLAKLPQGMQAVKLQVTVTEFSVESGATRFFAGALAGANNMTVAVKVMNLSGETMADFDVVRSSNPGGYGAFYDQKAATIDTVADGVADVMSGMLK
jgi:Domain of unknown function (DUF4410)